MKVASREQSNSQRCESLCQSVAKTVFHLVLRAGFCYLESIMAIMRARQNQIPRPLLRERLYIALFYYMHELHAICIASRRMILKCQIKLPRCHVWRPVCCCRRSLREGERCFCLSTNNESCAARGENIYFSTTQHIFRSFSPHCSANAPESPRRMEIEISLRYEKKGKCGAWKFVLYHVAYRLISLIQGVLKVIAVRRTRRGSHFVIATE